MSLIEGVGDEVTVLFVLLVIFIVVCLAWVSTSVSDRTAIRVVILDRARFQQFLRRITNRGRPQVENPQNSDNEITTSSANSSEIIGTQSDTGPTLDAPGSTAGHLFVKSPEEPQASVVEPPSAQTLGVTSEASCTSVQETEVPQAVLDSFLSSTLTPTNDREQVQSQQPPNSSNDPEVHNSELSESQDVDGPEQQTCGVDGSDKQHVCSSTNDAAKEPAPDTSSPSEPCVGVAEEQIPEGHIRIRLKYLDERQKLVQARPEDTIGQFKRKHFSVELADNFTVRFIYRGIELREDRSTLQANRIEDNSVIHCLMSRITQSEQPLQQQENLDVGFLMLPLFAVILCLLWYCRFTYRSYFSAVSTLSLIGISFLFLVGVLAFFRRGAHEHED